MATVNQEAIETFMSITGAPESVAIQRLQDFGGNLNEAVNAHFSEGDRNVLQEAPISGTGTPNDLMDIDDPPILEPRGPTSLLSATRGINPFSLLDPAFRSSLLDNRNIFDTNSEIMGRAPFVTQPREIRQIPIEVKDDGDNLAAASGHGPRIEDVTDTIDAEGPQTRATVIVADEDDDVISGDIGANRNSSRPSAPQFDDEPGYANDIEEEMIRAAIEASKRDAELQNNQGLDDVSLQQGPPQRDDAEIAHAVSLSLKSAEQESLQREVSLKAGASGSTANDPVGMEELGKTDEPVRRLGVSSSDKSSSSRDKIEAGASSIQDDVDELDEQPLVRNRSRRRSAVSARAPREAGESEVSPAVNPPEPTVASQAHPNGNAFPTDEWGGISSEEHDEAVMLEAAMFGGIPESGYRAPYAPHHMMHPGVDTSWRMPRPPSPGLVAQRAIREQQDDEYLAALQADREKEIKAIEDEKAAREAELEEQKRKEEESRKKLEEEQELERQLAAKEASLPEEPLSDNENAVTLLVRMPDGNRRGRRFLRSDKLQSLFDFIDIGRAVKPGAYRLVRPYPRQAFSSGDSNLSLNEVGLTSKQEALFLELI